MVGAPDLGLPIEERATALLRELVAGVLGAHLQDMRARLSLHTSP
jgi:hypothetical protein